MKRNSFLVLITILNSVLFFSQAGNVGISTSTPGSRLTVNGSFAAPYKSVTTSITIDAKRIDP